MRVASCEWVPQGSAKVPQGSAKVKEGSAKVSQGSAKIFSFIILFPFFLFPFSFSSRFVHSFGRLGREGGFKVPQGSSRFLKVCQGSPLLGTFHKVP